LPGFSSAEINRPYDDLQSLHDVDLFITQSPLGVAENGAVWLKDESLHERVLPFISKHVAVIIDQRYIVATMHEAYEQISDSDYAFGTFIAGPSKTADIEQSLVLGAHGAMTMTVFIRVED
jgi:L-lactate dehydrogenase complex protein LldG